MEIDYLVLNLRHDTEVFVADEKIIQKKKIDKIINVGIQKNTPFYSYIFCMVRNAHRK